MAKRLAYKLPKPSGFMVKRDWSALRRIAGPRWEQRLLQLTLVVVFCGCSYIVEPYYASDDWQVPTFADADVDQRLILIGDAGAPDPKGEPGLQTLAAQVRRIPDRTTVVFLGDNIYERGMPDEGKSSALDKAADVVDALIPDIFDSRVEAERYIDAQISVVRGTTARAIFLPGNHDWDQFERDGWQRILTLGSYIDSVAAHGPKVALRPRGGCPGPEAIPLGSKATLIVLDTQWWLEPSDDKPTPDDNKTDCPYTTESEIQDALRAALENARKQRRWTVVAGHHPLMTNGPHGGFSDIRTHLFPLRILGDYVPTYMSWFPAPVIGTAVVGLRACCSPSGQDTSNRRNQHLRRGLMAPMVDAERDGGGPLLYAAGHDHSLQLFRSPRGPRYTVVSGLGSSKKASSVGSNRHTLFAHSNPAEPGFMSVDFLRNGKVRLAVIEHTDSAPEGEEVYSTFLADAPPGKKS